MSAPERPGGGWEWAVDKRNALRLGTPLATEVPGAGAERRAFVVIRPVGTAADRRAAREGWKRSDQARVFRLDHWDYDIARIAGQEFDFDLGLDHDHGAILIREAEVTGEAELIGELREWDLYPGRFRYVWQTDAPR
ncbi:hypothetical protein BJF79_04980 [Actinomadura sp. CNU-125]|uniref:hypothetical protein n=1 Tax=Actinomadura sp. CNU-125 TaxID=1904961 RepID=UPI000966487E|nr:hypothetical protein [Actinomadura sp. CNU-125]OLT10127.1 hypothetical protein BJF79_04980 [Actinomadura sp. CNU-125]